MKNNKKLTVVSVVIAALLCVGLIAIPVLVHSVLKLRGSQNDIPVEIISDSVSFLEEDYDTLHAGYEYEPLEDNTEGMLNVPIWVSYMYGEYYLTEDSRRCMLSFNGEDDNYFVTVQSIAYNSEDNIDIMEFSCENGIRTVFNTILFENFVTGVQIEISPSSLGDIVVMQHRGDDYNISGTYNRVIEKEN